MRSALNFTRSPGLKLDTSAASARDTMVMPGMPSLSMGPCFSVTFPAHQVQRAVMAGMGDFAAQLQTGERAQSLAIKLRRASSFASHLVGVAAALRPRNAGGPRAGPGNRAGCDAHARRRNFRCVPHEYDKRWLHRDKRVNLVSAGSTTFTCDPAPSKFNGSSAEIMRIRSSARSTCVTAVRRMALGWQRLIRQ